VTRTKTASLGVLVFVGVLVSGCAGARVAITADHARYPISLSPVVRDSAGRLWPAGSLKKVGTLAARRSAIGILYSGLTPRSTYDISDEVNAQVAAAGGEAVIDLSVSVRDDCTALNAFPILNALPFWPGCAPIVVTGDIVRR
jgi:hypothetical protein